MHSFTFSTAQDTKSNRRDRTFTVEAATFDEARGLALDLAERATRSRGGVFITLISCDGAAPTVAADIERRIIGGREIVVGAFTFDELGNKVAA